MPITFNALVTVTTLLTTNVVYEYPRHLEGLPCPDGLPTCIAFHGTWVTDRNPTSRKQVTRVYETQIFKIEGVPWVAWTFHVTNNPTLIRETITNEVLQTTSNWVPASTNVMSGTNGTPLYGTGIILNGANITVTNSSLIMNIVTNYESLLQAK